MAKVFFLDPIDHISGKISKQHRTMFCYRRASKLKYTSIHGDRSTPTTTKEMELRNRFKVVREAARLRAMDLMHLTYDQMDFIDERKIKGAAFKYTTYKGWLFGKAWKCFDESTNQVNWPERLNTLG
ncbi:MAG: hypothetical protein SPK97_03890 [Bacteroidales bacterium]|nr:hypothetical protein [Bacteroidales bacterium]